MIKETEEYVSDELEDFYDDVSNSNRRLRLLLHWQSELDISAEVPKMEFDTPKKKFQPKVKRPIAHKKNGRHGRSATF